MINSNRVLNEFITLASFDSESFHEKNISEYLVNKLTSLGFEVSVDDAGKKLSDNIDSSGNIYAFLKGNIKGEPILLSAHMDTVSPGKNKKVIVHNDGKVTSDGTTVLGSDDITGIVTILESINVIIENNISHPDIEVVFFVAEEPFCKGSSLFDYSLIKSKNAYVFDLSGSIGTIANQAPSIYSFEATFHGKAAHSGFEPENGIDAILIASKAISKLKLGRIDQQTTANIGIINGGTGKNIVPNLVSIKGEVRSLSDLKALDVLNNIKATFDNEAKLLKGTVEFKYIQEIQAYNIELESKVITNYSKALNRLNYGKPNIITTFGGSDNNNFNKHGIEGIVVSNAMNDVHTVNEYFYLQDLYKSINIAIELIKGDR